MSRIIYSYILGQGTRNTVTSEFRRSSFSTWKLVINGFGSLPDTTSPLKLTCTVLFSELQFLDTIFVEVIEEYPHVL